uniref:BHLH transcription factor n=1 Tax=Torenia fournieri TaxID=68875 RepID=N0DQT8_9LAMI|nr:bHLH transcription factor [Torenia fournieri]
MDNEVVTENLKKQLALAVRSIQWSYAIFWSVSSTQPGVLQWCDGYYNGDIKTRKTVQAVEPNADQLGLQRSDQLKELYESLHLGETNPQAKRPTAALSPEDLTDAEWYFLVCMSFVFNIDQGLPGKSFAKNQTIWLCNAHRADTKLFSRSLLAKSASIQTIVCFPQSGGIVELGTTDLVPEDLNLIQRIKTSFLDNPESALKFLDHVSNDVINNNELVFDHDRANIPEDGLNQLLNVPDVDLGSPNDSSNEFADNLLREESNLVEDVEGEASQIQSWPFMDDAISNCLNNSANSSDCVSQTYGDAKASVPVSAGKKEANSVVSTRECNEAQECSNHQNNNSSFQGNDFHYQSVISNVLKGSHQLILGPYSRNVNKESSFASWTKDASWGPRVPQPRNPQNLLKKVLFEVAKMHENNSRIDSGKQKITTRQDDDNDRNHVLSERKRREKINERFSILGSLVPSGGKLDKVSVLDHTIEYLRELERKVEELESYKEAMERESVAQSKTQDAIERTSDNYGPNGTTNSKRPLTNKRKACNNEKTGDENKRVRLRDSDNVSIKVSDKEVLIEMRCSWNEHLLFGVMEAISKLNMESETVQSSNTDGLLHLTIKAKFKGLKAASASVIRQALQKVIKKS